MIHLGSENYHVCLLPKNKHKTNISSSEQLIRPILYHTIKEIQQHSTGDRHLGHSPTHPPTFGLSTPDQRTFAFQLAVQRSPYPFTQAFRCPALQNPPSSFCVRPKRERERDEEDAAESVRERERVRRRADACICGRACALASQRRLLYRHCESRIQSRSLCEDVSLLLLRSVSSNRLSI